MTAVAAITSLYSAGLVLLGGYWLGRERGLEEGRREHEECHRAQSELLRQAVAAEMTEQDFETWEGEL